MNAASKRNGPMPKAVRKVTLADNEIILAGNYFEHLKRRRGLSEVDELTAKNIQGTTLISMRERPKV